MLLNPRTSHALLRAVTTIVCVCLVGFASLVIATQANGQISTSEYAERRAELLNQINDGIVLIKANSATKDMEQPGWIQSPSFYYFTGLADLPAAILALDGQKKEVHLFVPDAPISFGVRVESLRLEPGKPTATKLAVSSVRPWGEFKTYLTEGLSAGSPVLYIEKPRRQEEPGVPSDFLRVSGNHGLWEQSLDAAFPGIILRSVTAVINEIRWVKSPSEIEILSRNANLTTLALLAAARRIEPGLSQRQIEATVVQACLENGGQGPSFWPWAMSGPNTQFQNLVRSFYDYDGLNRDMQSGELVRLDIGCGADHYGADVGRTVPVSGHFSDEQRIVWNLLILGYQAGIDSMRAGRSVAEVQEASRRSIQKAGTADGNGLVRRISEAMTSENDGVNWHLHGVGIESGEQPMATLQEGTVLAYEPMFSWGSDAYYLEDMIAVTASGAVILSTGLPYTTEEIEQTMSGNPSHGRQ